MLKGCEENCKKRRPTKIPHAASSWLTGDFELQYYSLYTQTDLFAQARAWTLDKLLWFTADEILISRLQAAYIFMYPIHFFIYGLLKLN